MSWSRWYAIKSYVLSTVWIAPVIALALEQATFRLAIMYNLDFGWIPGFVGDRDAAIATTDVVITSEIALIVFAFSSLLVAIQVASAQLTPRIIATMLLRDNAIRASVALFIYALLLAVAVKARIDSVPRTLVSILAIMALVNMCVFMFLIDYAARLLRPVSIVSRLAQLGLKVIDEVYPDHISTSPVAALAREKLGPSDRTVAHSGASAIVIAVNLQALVAEAKRANVVIEFVPRVGDFVPTGEPLFLLRGIGANEVDDRVLRGQVAFGPERTIEQDSTFAFRVIIDIALKALSPAINDPTTAVLAIDQLQRLLRTVGQRNLHDERIFDSDGRLRLLFPTPNWPDFVHLTFTEIRHCGIGNVQIARRLRAMIESISPTLPGSRLPALRKEQELLDRSSERLYAFAEDLALTRIPDSQGLGGTSYVPSESAASTG